jgi:hypothetical protein
MNEKSSPEYKDGTKKKTKPNFEEFEDSEELLASFQSVDLDKRIVKET